MSVLSCESPSADVRPGRRPDATIRRSGGNEPEHGKQPEADVRGESRLRHRRERERRYSTEQDTDHVRAPHPPMHVYEPATQPRVQLKCPDGESNARSAQV